MIGRFLNKVKTYSSKALKSGKTYGNLGSSAGGLLGGSFVSPFASLPASLAGRRAGYDLFSTVKGLQHGVFSKHPRIKSLPLRKRIGVTKNIAISNSRKLNGFKPYKGDGVGYAIESGIETVFPKAAAIPGASTAITEGLIKTGKFIKNRTGFSSYYNLAEFNRCSLGDFSHGKVHFAY